MRGAVRGRRITGKPGSPGEAQCCGGLNPGGIDELVAGKRKPPPLFGINLATYRGLDSTLNNSRIAANGCHCNKGGCMTLAQLGLVLWDDLAAPVLAGILVSIIVSRMDNRK